MPHPLHRPKLDSLAAQAALRAGQRGVAEFGPEFYLEALLLNACGLPVMILRNLGIALDDLMIELLTLLKRPPAPPLESPPVPNEAAHRALLRADAIAAQLNHEWVGQTHLLLSLIQDLDSPTGELLKRYGVQFDAVRDALLDQLARDQADAAPLKPVAPFPAVRSQLLTAVMKETPHMARLWRRREYYPEDLLAALLYRGQGRAIQILRDLGVDLVELSLALETRAELAGEEPSPPSICPSELANAVLAHSRELAESLRHHEVDTEHLLLALLRIDSMARSLLTEFHLNEADVQRMLSK